MGKRTRKPPSACDFLAEQEEKKPLNIERMRRLLLYHRGLTLDELAKRLDVTKGKALDGIEFLRQQGANLHEFGGAYSIERQPRPRDGDVLTITSDAEGWHHFGLVADSHLGSKYAREDLLMDLYDWFAENKIQNVFHCGNWIDGEARFNRFDLIPEAHGMQAQLDYFVAKYPRREGIKTYYVAGDDHEGWYSQREGVEIGQMLQQTARDSGREDLVYLGYKEAFVQMKHKRTGEMRRLLVDHPGGGSAYALSYAAQKRVEGLQGGEKPAIWAFGHWHKHGYFVVRNVHVLLVPCTKDLDPFGRKKGLEYTLGGIIVSARQGEAGAIEELQPRFRLCFDRGYYNQQFTPNGRVRKVKA